MPDSTLGEWLDSPSAEPESPPAKPKGIQKVSYTHDALIDLIIAHPSFTQNQLAEHFGYTASWISQIISSDAFQSRLADRKAELVDPAIRATVEEGFQAMVRRSHAILMEKLNRPADKIPDNFALQAFAISSRAAGYGARDNSPKVQVNVVSHLEDLSGNLTALLRRKRAEVEEIVDAQVDVQAPVPPRDERAG